MKKLLLAVSILVCTAAAMTSCNNGNYDANPNTDNSGTRNPLEDTTTNPGGGGNNNFNWTGTDPMSAKVTGGSAFQATTGFVQDANGYLAMSGTNGTTTIQIAIPSGTSAGSTVNFGGANVASYSENFTDIYTTSSGGSGAVKLTEKDVTHVKGYFYFTAKNTGGTSKTITEGYFNINR